MSGADRPQKAVILAVGSEMLTPDCVDTNSLAITEVLDEYGIAVRYKTVVSDDGAEVAAHLGTALERADLIIVTGGLGPTSDDVTREAVAELLSLPMEEDAAIVAQIRQRFAARGGTMPDINRRQAQVPRGAIILPNAHGTAPGLWLELGGGKAIALLPGPPREMKPMLHALAFERLATRGGGRRLRKRVIKVAGRTESRVEELTREVYLGWRDWPERLDTTILAASGQIELHVSARSVDPASAGAALDRAVQQIVDTLGHDVVSTDGRSIEQVVGDLLRSRQWRVALAESCTGGLATSRLTDVPGSSAYVERTIVAYSNDAKTELLAVPADLLRAHGAVSEPVAVAMATGVRDAAKVDIGVGITGIAGPGGGSDEKPVGTVVIAVVHSHARVRTFRFPGAREAVKTFASYLALDMMRRTLLDAPHELDWARRS